MKVNIFSRLHYRGENRLWREQHPSEASGLTKGLFRPLRVNVGRALLDLGWVRAMLRQEVGFREKGERAGICFWQQTMWNNRWNVNSFCWRIREEYYDSSAGFYLVGLIHSIHSNQILLVPWLHIVKTVYKQIFACKLTNNNCVKILLSCRRLCD